MELKEGIIVQAPCDGNTVKKGNKYLITEVFNGGDSFFIKSKSTGANLYCRVKNCRHLLGGDWIIVNPKPKKDHTKAITWFVIFIISLLFASGMFYLFSF